MPSSNFHHNHSEYRDSYKKILDSVELHDREQKMLALPEVIKTLAQTLVLGRSPKPHAYFIGNGGSAAIASHRCANFIKYFEVPAYCFTDPALLTCFSNDYGYEAAFEKLTKVFVKKGDLFFAISSSGQSPNILRGAQAAKGEGALLITLSGFKPDNPLRRLGDYNFYVPSHSYRYVESAHLHIFDYLIDYGISLKTASQS